jgi:NitT/TauT family transport system substrate-binding protein
MRARKGENVMRHRVTRSSELAAALLLAVLTVVVDQAGAGNAETLDRLRLRIGLPAPGAAFLPLYVAAERTARAEALELELLTFRGASGLAPAVASDSVDVGLASLNTVIRLIDAGQAVKVFYGGLSLAEAAWYGRPPVRTWEDLRGRTIAVPTFGGYVDLLTRRALKKRGLVLGRDVQVARMVTSTALPALVAGRIDAALLQLPFAWEAQSLGLARLGSEAEEAGAPWPKNLFFAKTRLLESYPRTIRALLRAHVSALRLAKADRDLGADTLARHVGYSPAATDRAYREVVGALGERGEIPAESLKVFWEITVEAGEQPAAWPETRYLDRRLIDSFEAWAPRPTP